MITRNPSLTDQVKSHLKSRIINEEFDGGRIPPETELATDLGVSRTTVRDALSRLEHEGTIYRRQGAGTFVNPTGLQIKSRLEEIWSYEQVLRDHGYTPSVQVLASYERPADEATSEALDLAEGAEVLVIEKRFLEDDEPVMFTINQIPRDIVQDVIDEADEGTPVYEFLEDHCDRTLGYYLSEIVPVVVDDSISDTLGIPEGTPVLSFDEIGYDQNNEPVVRATSYFRDDLLRFRLIRRRTGS
jgi:GntR family transcriptional regulator